MLLQWVEHVHHSCPHCGASIPAIGVAFCSECREALDEPASTPSVPLPVSDSVATTRSLMVWYASESRWHSQMRISPRDDLGFLEPGPGRLRFVGRKMPLDCPEVQSISLVPQPLPWLSLLLGDAVVLVMMGMGAFSFFTLNNPMSIPMIVGLNLLAVLMSRSIRWIVVDYVTSEGNFLRAYFTAGTAMGGVSRRSDTVKLFDALRESILLPLADRKDQPPETGRFG